MTISQYIRERIVDMFLDIAEMINAGQIDLAEDELAGVPLMLFKGQNVILDAWYRFLAKEIPSVNDGESSMDSVSVA